MSQEFKVGDPVKANRDGKLMMKGETGTINECVCIDSDDYVFVNLDDGRVIGPSASSYWNKVTPKRTVKIILEGFPNTGRTAMAEVIKRKLASLNVPVINLDQSEGLNELWDRTNPEDIVKQLKENGINVEIVLQTKERF